MALFPPVRFTVSLLPDTITVSLESVRATLVLLAETVPLLIVGSLGCDIGLTVAAPSARDGPPIKIARRHREVGRVLSRRHRVAEGQQISPGAAGVGRSSAIVEGKRRRATGPRDRVAQAPRP